VSIREHLDPGTLITVADRAEPCVLCGKPTTGRSTGEGAEAVHFACLQGPLCYALAKRRGEIQAAGTWWGARI